MAHRPLLDDLLPKQEVQLRKKIEQKKLLLDVGIQGFFFAIPGRFNLLLIINHTTCIYILFLTGLIINIYNIFKVIF